MLYLFYQNTFIELLLLWLLYPLSFIFQSAYFFQGLEKNALLAFFVLVSRIFTLIFIFVFISDSSDLYLVPTLIGGTYMFAGILSFLYIWIKYKISLNLIDLIYIKELIQEGKEIFFGNVSVILFRGSNVLLLEVFTHDSIAVSAYSIAEKFIKSLQAVMRPLNQYYFPKAIVILEKSTYPDRYSFLQLLKLSIVQLFALLFLIIILFIIYLNRSYIDVVNTYPHIEHIVTVMAIMLPAVFVGILNFMFGSVGLNHLNMKSYYAKAIFTTGVISLLVASILIVYLKDYGAAMAFLISESLLFSFIMLQYLKKNPNKEI
jgi:PST family polysaccharide transporter